MVSSEPIETMIYDIWHMTYDTKWHAMT
jgi:hypothetical protein